MAAVKAKLQSLVPTMVETREPRRFDFAALRRHWRIALIALVVFVLSGWTHWPDELAYIFFVCAVILSMCSLSHDRRAVRGWQSAGLMLVLAGGFLAVFTLASDTLEFDTQRVSMALSFGVVAAGFFADSVRDRRLSRDRDTLAHAMDDRRRAGVGDAAIADSFDPHWAVKSADDLSVWAIDPDRRVLRVMYPAEKNVDEILVWDAPISSVDLARIPGSQRWAFFGNSVRYVRGDRDLRVTTGIGTHAWTFMLPFYGTDLEQAKRWRDTFETWMHEDQREASAMASVH